MKNKRTTGLLILSIFTTVVVVGSFVFFLRIIKNKNEHTSVVIATLEEKMRQKENAAVFAEKNEEIKSLENFISSHFVDSNKIDEFVSYLENLGSITNAEVSVKGIDVPKDTTGMINFELSIVGAFHEVSETITLLENIPYQVDIIKVYLNKNLKQNTEEETIPSASSTWQADIAFNILSLN